MYVLIQHICNQSLLDNVLLGKLVLFIKLKAQQRNTVILKYPLAILYFVMSDKNKYFMLSLNEYNNTEMDLKK